MCLPALGRVEPFAGAKHLLAGVSSRGVAVVVVSNVMWRDAEAHRRDFDDLGLSEYVSGYVSSLDVGWRKPHPSFFESAVGVAGCSASECAMVGDSERNDIAPAHARGMFTVLVAIEGPPPETTVADHVARSLDEVREVLSGRS